MCRNIKTLFNFEPPATEDEIHASALQFVRKLSGFNKPSQANAEAFDRAVAEVSASARRLLVSLHTHAPARDRRDRGREGQGTFTTEVRLIGASAACMMASIFQPSGRDHDAFSPIETRSRCISRLLDRGDVVVERIF